MQQGKMAVVLEAKPKQGDKIHLPNGDDKPTVAEVVEVVERGKELVAVIKAAREDGKITRQEVVLIIAKGLEVASLTAWDKIGRFFARLFGRK